MRDKLKQPGQGKNLVPGTKAPWDAVLGVEENFKVIGIYIYIYLNLNLYSYIHIHTYIYILVIDTLGYCSIDVEYVWFPKENDPPMCSNFPHL